MGYYLNFSFQELKRDGNQVIYDPDGFDEKPIRISVPEVVNIFEKLLITFEEKGLIETLSKKKVTQQTAIQKKDIKVDEDPKINEALGDENQKKNTDENAKISETIGDKTQEINTDENSNSHNAVNDESQATAQSVSPLKGLSGKVYYCQVKNLNSEALTQFCRELIGYIQKSSSQMNPENFISDDASVWVSGIMEALEIRNYLARYTKNSSKKNIQNGYLYVMPS
ncbi:hypothetical protein [Spirulina subsalsa]|uniref:hypothetical protein n=1 Tax=Spirulina subsalsa TaxID=54311 RepID=UPI0002EB9F86|nr:hypothetical protein [Spirulina subsalsa]